MIKKSYLSPNQFKELKAFAARHGIQDNNTLFEIVKGLDYQAARNAIVGYGICQGVD